VVALKFPGHHPLLILIKARNAVQTVGNIGRVKEDRGKMNSMEVNLI